MGRSRKVLGNAQEQFDVDRGLPQSGVKVGKNKVGAAMIGIGGGEKGNGHLARSVFSLMALSGIALDACGDDASACDYTRKAQLKIEACLQDGYSLPPIAFQTDPCKAEDACLVGCVLRVPACSSMVCAAITDPNAPPTTDPALKAFCDCVSACRK